MTYLKVGFLLASAASAIGLACLVGGVMLAPWYGASCLLLTVLGFATHTPLMNLAARLHNQRLKMQNGGEL